MGKLCCHPDSMKTASFAITAILLGLSAPAQAQNVPAWSQANIDVLRRWVSLAPMDALPTPSTAALDKAVEAGDAAAVTGTANELALKLARMHLLGSAGLAERRGWNIVDSDKAIDLEVQLARSLDVGTLDEFYASLLPRNPNYTALRTAYSAEEDPARRLTIARNLERWRWMPRSLGDNHVLVNTAAFEAHLWRNGREADKWDVIVGKPSTPSAVFDTQITGVNLNPWWNIPASIVAESVGALMRRSPATARARGYVREGSRYRQKPGPNNALGQMKLVMPNRFSIYMHDTPNKDLFDKEVRAFSHGCIRTKNAIDYAATLLEGVKSREEIDAILASGKSTTVDLAQPVPVYIAYFTAESDGHEGYRILPDIYRWDPRLSAERAN